MSTSEPEAPHLSSSAGGGDSRLAPIAVGLWVGAWLGTGWGWLMVVGLVVAVGAVGVAWRRTSWLAGAVAVAVLGGCLMGGWRAWALESSAVSEVARSQGSARIEGVVVSEPVIRESAWGESWIARVRLVSVETASKRWGSGETVLVMASGEAWRSLRVGTRFGVLTTLDEPNGAGDVIAVARARGAPSVKGDPSPVLQVIERVREGLRAAADGLAPEARALVPALVVGDTASIDADLKADFSATGLTHLTAVSGANLTFLLAFVGVASRWVGLRGRWLRGASVVGIVAFVALCRAEPSVVRAATMGVVALGSLGRARGRSGLRPLAVAVCILVVWDPWMSRSWGFALSVFATGGIVAWAGVWADRFSQWMWRPLAEAIGVTLAAQIATLPLVAVLSGQVSVVSLAANLAAGPLVGPATVLGFGAAAVCLVWPGLAAVLAWGAGWFALGIAAIARTLAGLPGSQVSWPADPVSLAILTAACAAAAVVMPHIAGSTWGSLALMGVLVVTAVWGPIRPGWPPDRWRIAACDVGQGDGFVIRAGPAAAVMVDTGPDPGLAEACLRTLGVTSVPLLILTHGHADHVGGLSGVVSRVRGGVAVLGSAGFGGPAGQAVVDQLDQARVTRPAAESGAVMTVGEAEVRILDAPVAPSSRDSGAGEGESSAENDASLAVGVVHTAADGTQVSVLFVGDRGPDGQAELVTRGVPDVDVLAVPHHGSSRQDPNFLSDSRAELALISCGADNTYGHPADKTLSELGRNGMQTFRTDSDGAIALSGSPDNLVVTSVH